MPTGWRRGPMFWPSFLLYMLACVVLAGVVSQGGRRHGLWIDVPITLCMIVVVWRCGQDRVEEQHPRQRWKFLIMATAGYFVVSAGLTWGIVGLTAVNPALAEGFAGTISTLPWVFAAMRQSRRFLEADTPRWGDGVWDTLKKTLSFRPVERHVAKPDEEMVAAYSIVQELLNDRRFWRDSAQVHAMIETLHARASSRGVRFATVERAWSVLNGSSRADLVLRVGVAEMTLLVGYSAWRSGTASDEFLDSHAALSMIRVTDVIREHGDQDPRVRRLMRAMDAPYAQVPEVLQVSEDDIQAVVASFAEYAARKG